MRKKITKQQLKYLSDDLREIIKDYMKQHDLSVYGFATLTKIQTNQMHLFLTEQR